jgi:hypothetical protein
VKNRLRRNKKLKQMKESIRAMNAWNNINWKKNTALFVIGQALSMFGTMVVQYAIIWHITLKTQSGTMMTLFTIAGFLPMFLFHPLAESGRTGLTGNILSI